MYSEKLTWILHPMIIQHENGLIRAFKYAGERHIQQATCSAPLLSASAALSAP